MKKRSAKRWTRAFKDGSLLSVSHSVLKRKEGESSAASGNPGMGLGSEARQQRRRRHISAKQKDDGRWKGEALTGTTPWTGSPWLGSEETLRQHQTFEGRSDPQRKRNYNPTQTNQLEEGVGGQRETRVLSRELPLKMTLRRISKLLPHFQ